MRTLDDPPRTAELVVVGGGVVGAATAFEAARAGLRPVLLEARPALCTLTTPVAAGAFRLQFEDRDELELVRRSVEVFLSFEEATGQDRYRLGVRRQGYLWLTTTEEGAARQRELVAQLHRWGQTDVELLPGDEVRARFPYVGPEVVQARFRAGDGFLDPKALTFGLVEGSGAGVVPRCRATGFRLEGDRLRAVETTRGTVGCEAAVVACGPFSGVLAAGAGVRLPIEAVRRHKLVLPDLPLVPAEAPMTIDEDTGVHWRPAAGGAWALFTDPATPPSEPTMDVPTDHRFAFDLLDPGSPHALARVVPFWRRVWEHGAWNWLLQAGQYDVTPDHRPLLGRTGVEGLLVHAGYSGHGVMGSVGGARIVVDDLLGKLAPEDNPFRLDRDPRAVPPPTL